MVFMYAGYIFRNKIDEDSKIVKVVGLFAFVFWIYMAWCKGVYIELATRQYPLSVVCIIVALCGSLCIIQFSKSIENLKVSSILIFFGRNSLDLLCIHQLDGYFSFLWKSIALSEFIGLLKINPFHANIFFHVIADLTVLVLWILIKEKILKRIATTIPHFHHI